MFINCKINENFTTLEENIILPETNSATDRNVHYRIDSTGNYTIDTNVTGFRCGKERDNYYFIDVNPNREQDPGNNFNLLFNRIQDKEEDWTKVNVGIDSKNCRKWFKHNNVYKNLDRYENIEVGTPPLIEMNIEGEGPSNIDEALDLCSRNENCMIVSDNTKWKPTVEYEYIFNARLLTFNQHIEFAKRIGFQLVSIHSDKENEIVRQTIPANMRNRSTFIGLARTTSNNSIFANKWVDGTPFTYRNWNGREPNNWGGRENYAEILWNGRWNDIRNVRRQAVYKRIKTPNYTDNYRYEINLQRLNWNQHQNIAEKKGGNLTSITSEYENLLVENILFNSPATIAFIGGERHGQGLTNSRARGSRAWRWVDGSAWTFDRWPSWEPNNRRETVLEIRRGWIARHGSGWNDIRPRHRVAGIYKILRTDRPHDNGASSSDNYINNKKYHFWQRDNFGGIFSTYNRNEQQNIDLATPHDLYHKVCFNRSDNVEKAGFNRDDPLTIQLNNTVEINRIGDPCPNNGMGNFNKSSNSINKDSLQQFVFPMSDEDLRKVIREFVIERKDIYTGRNTPNNLITIFIRTFFPGILERDQDQLIERIIDFVFKEIKKTPPEILTAYQTNRNLFNEQFKRYIDNLIQELLSRKNEKLARSIDYYTRKLDSY